MILNSFGTTKSLCAYDRRRRVALAPSPTTPEWLARAAITACRQIVFHRKMEAWLKGRLWHSARASYKAERLDYEEDVIVAANTLIKMHRREA